MKDKRNILVSVYGTLRRGFGNNKLLKNSEFLGETEISGFSMYSLGGFPGIIIDKSNTKNIKIELFKVTQEELNSLDRLEGYPDFYDRMLVHTEYGDSYIYFLHSKNRYHNELPLVESGDWKLYSEKKSKVVK